MDKDLWHGGEVRPSADRGDCSLVREYVDADEWLIDLLKYRGSTIAESAHWLLWCPFHKEDQSVVVD